MMLRIIGCLCLFIGVAAGPGVSNATTIDAASRTTRAVIDSDVLGEERTLWTRTPPGHDLDTPYPVVYVLDGEWNLELVASYLDYMADNDLFPPFIVTGIVNVNRNRDYVPRTDRYFDDTGQADRFLRFVREEWIPHMNAHYTTSENRVLVGHSFGGVFTLHAFFTASDLFDAYIALGSSAWIAERILFEEAEAWFENPLNPDAFVYMAVGEGDGGPTVPSSRDLAALFELHAPATLDWTYLETPRTDHFKNVVAGMNEAFMALFPAWEFEDELMDAAVNGGARAVDRWFDSKSRQLGWRFVPAWFDIGVAALGMVRADHHDAALATVRQLVGYHPDNAHVAAFSANVLEQTGDYEAAIAEYRRAMQLADRQGLHPNGLHKGRLERGLERSRAGLDR